MAFYVYRLSLFLWFASCLGGDLSLRIKRQQPCISGEFRCGGGECIKKTLICDGRAQCKDGSDETPFNCYQIAKDCAVPKIADGTLYSLVDCSKNSKDCKTMKSSAVKVSCSPGYNIPLSVNESTILECPRSEWNHYSTQCMKCGRSPGTSDIKKLGTFPSDVTKHPWYVAVYRTIGSTSHLICGGTLITPKFVVTAAHCVAASDIGKAADDRLFRVVAAPLSAIYEPNSARTRSVSRILLKKQFNGEVNSYNENIALLKLSTSFQLDDNINVICLYSQSKRHRDFPSDPILTVVRWELRNKQSRSFQEVNFRMTDLKNCRKFAIISDQRFFSYDKFCLLYDPGKNSLQQSDSGSGIIITIGGVNYIYGIVSAKILGHDNFSVVTNLTKQERWIRNTIAVSMEEKCLQDQIQCNNGDCLGSFEACNGIKGCEDGLDEDPDFCSKIKRPQTENNNEKGQCFLPGFQEGTIFQMDNCTSKFCSLSSGSVIAPNTLVKVICKEGYAIPDLGRETDPSTCFKGNFYPPLSKCTKLCEPLLSESLDLKCVYRGEIVPCSESSLPTTKAIYKCKYQYNPTNPSIFKGENICNPTGFWKDKLPDCAPKCGKTSGKGSVSPLITNGTRSKVGDYPWHIALYQDSNEKFEHKCGGTILSPKIIMTAAHCVYQNKQLVSPKEFKVVAGKYYRDYYAANESNGQDRNIKSIMVGELYTGRSTDFESDIALIRVERSFVLNNFVLPACVDWAKQNIPSTGTVGTVVGWGLTENEEYSPELLAANLPYMDLRSCRITVKETDPFFRFLTHDKICVLYVNGTGTQEGDSGGGYTIMVDGLHYIYGIVSVKPRNRNTFAAFTNVISYTRWIKETMIRLEAE